MLSKVFQNDTLQPSNSVADTTSYLIAHLQPTPPKFEPHAVAISSQHYSRSQFQAGQLLKCTFVRILCVCSEHQDLHCRDFHTDQRPLVLLVRLKRSVVMRYWYYWYPTTTFSFKRPVDLTSHPTLLPSYEPLNRNEKGFITKWTSSFHQFPIYQCKRSTFSIHIGII